MGNPDIDLSLRILELGSPRSLRILRRVCWGIAILAGFLQVPTLPGNEGTPFHEALYVPSLDVSSNK